MTWTKNSIYISIVAVIFTFGMLSGGQWLWQKYALARPIDRVFQNINGVKSVTWEENTKQNSFNIHVSLQKVDNFPQTYKKLVDGASQTLGTKKFNIVVHDFRTPELDSFYNSVQYYIHEGIFTGNFSGMVERIQAQALAKGYEVKLSVDSQNVYMELSAQADNLYEVIPRNAAGVK